MTPSVCVLALRDQVNKMSPLALRHSDSAVLERHHAHTTFTILTDPECAIFSELNRKDLRRVSTHTCSPSTVANPPKRPSL